MSKWFNRGQPVVGRQLRSAVDDLGHESFVLARPKKEKGPRPGALDRDDVWDQPRVTEASAYEISAGEYDAWVSDNGIDAILCDQNYQFDEIARLRERGVRTVGRFVWEHFTERARRGREAGLRRRLLVHEGRAGAVCGDGHREPVRSLGVPSRAVGSCRGAARDSSLGRLRRRSREARDDWRYVFPGGFLGHRKPLEPVLEAFSPVPATTCACSSRRRSSGSKQIEPAERAAAADPRIELRIGDQPTAEHLRELAACDVCVAPARWEGLGLPLYEAIAFGQPAITNDAPPMNEAIHDDRNGVLVAGTPNGSAKSGIPALDPGRRRARGGDRAARRRRRARPARRRSGRGPRHRAHLGSDRLGA